MKVLLLTQVLPHPPDSGPKVKTAALLGWLAKHHEVTLISFTRGEQTEDLRALAEVCRAVHGVPIERGRTRDLWYLGRSLVAGESFLMRRDERAEMHALVRRVAASGSFDIVHVDQLNMAQYADDAPGAARVLDAHNALWMVSERQSQTLPVGPRRLLLGREARLLKSYEGRICREFEGVLAVSAEDRGALLEAAGGGGVEIAVVPIAVDVSRISVVRRRPASKRVLHIGSLIWPPTVDGLQWFLDKVWPLVRARRPEVEVDVVGGNPPPELEVLAEREPGIHVHGYVADPAPLYEGAAVMVVPLRAGGGMRVRILNGLAQGLPIVTTSIGCEGIAAEHRKHLLIADDAEGFAGEVLRLLDDSAFGEELGRNGRRLVEEKYDASVVCRAVDAVYAAAVENKRRAG